MTTSYLSPNHRIVGFIVLIMLSAILPRIITVLGDSSNDARIMSSADGNIHVITPINGSVFINGREIATLTQSIPSIDSITVLIAQSVSDARASAVVNATSIASQMDSVLSTSISAAIANVQSTLNKKY